MNIIYITRLTKNKWAGPNSSVPKQIEAQSKRDNVFWYNVNNLIKGQMTGSIKCHCVNEYSSFNIKKLPYPFNKPDLVIFEGLYFYPFLKIAKECRKYNIPYIIIPRSSLTDYAQQSKRIKKKIGNLLCFNKFIRNAAAIQYLTTKEYIDSRGKWNDNYIIIPNGIDSKDNVKQSFNSDKLKGVFIGRPDIYQKGLDLFLAACSIIKKELEANKCTIDIYGPDIKNYKSRLQEIIDNKKLNKLIFIKDGVYDDEKEKVLLKSDFFILTSRFEGHPMGLIEALSYGLPCLVTEGTNMADEIKNRDAGWTSDISVDGIVEAFKLLLYEKDRFAEKGKNALKLSKRYNWDELAKISNQKYREIIK